jgi:hypothetical protein
LTGWRAEWQDAGAARRKLESEASLALLARLERIEGDFLSRVEHDEVVCPLREISGPAYPSHFETNLGLYKKHHLVLKNVNAFQASNKGWKLEPFGRRIRCSRGWSVSRGASFLASNVTRLFDLDRHYAWERHHLEETYPQIESS